MAHYFVSDVHAGLGSGRSGERFAAWLDAVAADAEAIWLLGDIFDFWFEYKEAIPPGYEPLLERFRALTARGIALHFFPGNHDMWTLEYLSRSCGMTVHTGGYATEIAGRKIYMEHGDRQSIRGMRERLMQGIFRWEFARAVARKFVPHGKMMAFGRGWSQSNREKHVEAHVFKGDGEGVVRFARKYLRRHSAELFVFGHLHAPAEYQLPEGPMLYVLGDWITGCPAVYGQMDGNGFCLREFVSAGTADQPR